MKIEQLKKQGTHMFFVFAVCINTGTVNKAYFSQMLPMAAHATQAVQPLRVNQDYMRA